MHSKIQIATICYIVIFSCGCNSWGKFWEQNSAALGGAESNLVDTGQILCASGALGDSTLLSCPQTVTGQDGNFTNIPRARSFTGPTQHATFTSNYTTKDNVTGLVWKSCPEGLTGATCTGGTISTPDWNAATTTSCAALNSANSGSGYAGITSWRVPEIHELWRITSYAVESPALETNYFPPVSFSNDAFWAANTSVANTANAWFVNTLSGLVDSGGKGVSHYLRCVSGPGVSQNFADRGDNTVSDRVTHLRWQRCSKGLTNDTSCSGTTQTENWVTALSYCQGLTLAGKSWRLPNINELLSLVDISSSNPSINAAFPGTATNIYWSSTSTSTTSNAWNVNFASGFSGSGTKTVGLEVRCVANDD